MDSKSPDGRWSCNQVLVLACSPCRLLEAQLVDKIARGRRRCDATCCCHAAKASRIDPLTPVLCPSRQRRWTRDFQLAGRGDKSPLDLPTLGLFYRHRILWASSHLPTQKKTIVSPAP